ncbi:unnamed protein product [Musa acuminata subsp. malaccensis]|uniref:(wild Malaysian banana) hypothetical protein n=1 Tax=Musa acuminata subsp. malaccensis TaxID=214687 RepID=A0A804JYI7_MUSAM|nr:PREDICTED: transcription factor SPATULA-like isoform X1 [Musa acuminata subsp. malaccensis]XP_018684098.1 PREDICTED: transcription factor SPATULA-like isoform X1 [Musa acuminata subsp. malaccensis]CAG1857427.1 unnamed protein product [Musa acuminata subsp. malaccensis]
MDAHSRSLCSGSSGHAYYQGNQDQISFLLGHLSPTCSSYPSSDFPLAGAEDGFGAVGSSLLHSRMKSPDQDLDSLDCEIEVSEEPPKLAPARTSSSKRNRAAEVHNLSEKRRRSRINEKMKALQSLIPNSSKVVNHVAFFYLLSLIQLTIAVENLTRYDSSWKILCSKQTDKASMLDEAIEYLKQLQLQVQMLSMRNSLSQHPMFLSGGLQPLQALPMGIDFGLGANRAVNAVGMLPLNQVSSVPNTFDLSPSSNQSASIPSVINITKPETPVAMEPSQSHHGSFLLPVSIEEILTQEMITQQQPDTRHSPRNLTGESSKTPPRFFNIENEVNSMAADAAQHPGGQASSSVGADHVAECMLGRVRLQDEPSEKEEFIQHLRR